MQLPLTCAGGFGVDVLAWCAMDVGNGILSLRCSSIRAAGGHPGCFGRVTGVEPSSADGT